MAMFRSLVASAQQRQPPGGPAGGDSGLEAQYSCPICLEVYHRPVAIGSCGHTFCGECLQPCLQVPSPLCPLCRLPFDPKKVDKAAHVEKQLSSYKAPCRGCSKKVTLAKMRVHVASCVKVQEQMANCPKFVPVVPTSQPIPSAVPNRSTFACPYCGARNLDQQELVKHCVDGHRGDPNRVVCPICAAMPWGDPSYKSANFLQHLLHRHKFSYDTFVTLLQALPSCAPPALLCLSPASLQAPDPVESTPPLLRLCLVLMGGCHGDPWLLCSSQAPFLSLRGKDSSDSGHPACAARPALSHWAWCPRGGSLRGPRGSQTIPTERSPHSARDPVTVRGQRGAGRPDAAEPVCLR
ncbi:E3 ubiquitin-protein ligase RNF166 isoform X1 [Eubalaena glacialis]|uniref:E3 ubiquitin-protein ligase RNF166 isoform X1 n=1 Tax=Eubalaena glacialis TaxID=27606 RepID=UPI002A5AD863|nr:E3 ubiquitin-protein ligase RNF166 isoform X1 [Eubalaena glacialis]